MLGKIANIFSYSKKVTESDSSISNLVLLGKIIQKQPFEQEKELSDDCKLTMTVEDISTFSYKLCLQNQNYEFDKNDWNEYSFDITNERAFKLFKQGNFTVLVWEANEIFYLFYAFIDSKDIIKPFTTKLSKLICSYELEIVVSQVKDEDSESYISNFGEIESVGSFIDEQFSFMKKSNKEKVEDITMNIEKLSLENENKFIHSMNIKEVMFSEIGNLLRFNRANDSLVSLSNNALLKILKIDDFKYAIQVSDNDNVILTNDLNQELNLQGNESQNYVIWVGNEVSNKDLNAYNFIFKEPEIVKKLYLIVNKCYYEQSNKCKPQGDDKAWLDNIDELDFDDSEEEVKDSGFNDSNSEKYSNLNNICTAQALAKDRTLAAKDNNALVVYNTNDDNDLKYLSYIDPIKTYDGRNINIKNMKFFDSENSILLLSKASDNFDTNQDTIFKYDLNKMKIVDEYATNSKIGNINDFDLHSKYASMSSDPIIVGFNNNNVFTMDTRLNTKCKVASSREYSKATKTLFNSIATSSNGYIALGSVDGKIRLYKDNINSKTKASTCIPGFGDPVKSIDISSDQSYILTTYNNYLLLINTMEGKGFESSITKEAKAIKLQLSPMDIAKYNLFNYHFTPARFNIGDILNDTTISTSIGNYLIIWNFEKLKKGKKSEYKIKEMNQEVTDNKFMFNRADMIVTMQKKIGVQHEIK